jgi:hypothetical protein
VRASSRTRIGADGRRLALGGRQPALRQIGQALRIGDREDDVVLLDDALVEAVGLLVREAERGLEDRLLRRRSTWSVVRNVKNARIPTATSTAGEARSWRAVRARAT